MNAIEFLGFIITLGLTAFLFARKVREDQRRAAHPEQVEEEEQEQLEALQQLLGIEKKVEVIPEPKAPPPPPAIPKAKPSRTMGAKYEFKTDLVQYEETSGVESRTFEARVGDVDFPELGTDILSQDLMLAEGRVTKERPSKLQRWFQKRDLQQMIVFQEILKAPKGLQGLSNFHDDRV